MRNALDDFSNAFLLGSEYTTWAIKSDQDLAKCASDASVPFTSVPSPIRDFLQHLENDGKVRVELISHDVNKADGGDGPMYTIEPKEEAIFKPTPDSRSDNKVDRKNVSGLIKMSALMDSDYVFLPHKLTYHADKNRILSGCPGIFVKKPVRVKKGDVIRLA